MKTIHKNVWGILFLVLFMILFTTVSIFSIKKENMLSLSSPSSTFLKRGEINQEKCVLSSQDDTDFKKHKTIFSPLSPNKANDIIPINEASLTSTEQGRIMQSSVKETGIQTGKDKYPDTSLSAVSTQITQTSVEEKSQNLYQTMSISTPTISSALLSKSEGETVVGYYTSWSAYKGYSPLNVPADKLTHLNYAFAKIDPSSSSIVLAHPESDKKNFVMIQKLKRIYPKLKTLISVGGWDYSIHFSDVASTGTQREAFAQSCINFIIEHGFDGIDIDWEYPVSGGLAGNSNRQQDKQNFTLLLKAIRQKLDIQEVRDGRDYYLTIAGAANTSYLSKIEPEAVASVVDHIFIMAYDMHGPWDKYSDFGAPLFQPNEYSPHYKNSVKEAVMFYQNAGVPADKMVLGLPLYGYIYRDVNSPSNGLYSTFSSAEAISFDSIRNSYLDSFPYQQFHHQDAQVPYLYGNNTFISYENSISISAKVEFAKTMGLGGIGVWELSHDTSGDLLESAYQALN